MSNLTLLRWADVRQEWDWIKPCVEHIKEKCGEDWRAEDVYAACLNNKAQLFVGNGEWEKKGFFVLQNILNEYTLQNELFIWLLSGVGSGIPEPFFYEIRQIAHNLNCVKIKFKSPRRGWEKVPDIKPSTIEYEICLHP